MNSTSNPLTDDAGGNDLQAQFEPEINIFELGKKIRKLDGYIARAQLRIKKRQSHLDHLMKMDEKEQKLIEIGLSMIDPDKNKGSHA